MRKATLITVWQANWLQVCIWIVETCQCKHQTIKEQLHVCRLGHSYAVIRRGCVQCCSCLFVSGRTVVYRSHYKRPQFLPKVEFGGPNYRLQRLMLRLMLTGLAGLCWLLDRPGRTPSTCVAWQLQHWLCIQESPSILINPWGLRLGLPLCVQRN